MSFTEFLSIFFILKLEDKSSKCWFTHIFCMSVGVKKHQLRVARFFLVKNHDIIETSNMTYRHKF